VKRKGVILTCILYLILAYSCSKKDSGYTPPNPPPVLKDLVISDLSFSPSLISLKPYLSTVTIEGSITFQNANGGVSQVRLVTSKGIDTIYSITSAGLTEGRIVGLFTVGMPASPETDTFYITLKDVKGRESNRLDGIVEFAYDESATNWYYYNAPTEPWGAVFMTNVSWLNHEYVAVGAKGNIYTSPTGYGWSRQNAPEGNTLNGCAFNGSEFIAVGEQKTIISSTDGKTWQTLTSGGWEDGWLMSVATSGSTWVAVGSKFSGHSPNKEIYASKDGRSWSRVVNDDNKRGPYFKKVIWAGNQFVAVGDNRPSDHSSPLIATSPDGYNWTDRSLENPWTSLYDITYTGSFYIAIGDNAFIKSPDGITWSIVPANMTRGRAIVYTGKQLVAIGASVLTSPDGINWTGDSGAGNNDIETSLFKSIAWSPANHNYVMAGNTGVLVAVSP
jgi:hypothetical protein